MDPNKLQQFVNAALAKGHSYDDVTKFIDAQQKMQSILIRIEQGLTPEESKLQQGLQERAAEKSLDLQLLPRQKAIEQQATLELERKKMEQKAQFEAEHPGDDRQIKMAEKIIDELENEYFKERDGKISHLAYGEYGFGGRAPGVLKNLERIFAPSKGKPQKEEFEPASTTTQLNTYKRLLESSGARFAKAGGDAANVALMEQILQRRGFGDETSTPEEAIDLFKTARAKFGLEPNKRLATIEEKYIRPKQIETPTSVVGGQSLQVPVSQPQNPLMQLLQRGQQGGHTNLEANWLGKLLFPRASEVQSRQNRGEQVGLGERVGVAGETAANVLPFLGPGGLAMRLGLSGASRGLTEPGADVEKRLLEGGKQGLMGLLLGKGGQLAGKILRPIKTFGTAKNKAAEALEKEGGRIGDSKPLQVVSKDMLKAKIPDYTEAPLIKKLASGTGIKPTEGTRLLEMIRNKVYTKGGDEKTNQAAAYYDVLRKTLRGEFSQKAPDVIKNISRQRAVYKAGDFAKKGLFYAGPTAGLLYLASQIGQLGKGENR